jgi:hypothetical protein
LGTNATVHRVLFKLLTYSLLKCGAIRRVSAKSTSIGQRRFVGHEGYSYSGSPLCIESNYGQYSFRRH